MTDSIKYIIINNFSTEYNIDPSKFKYDESTCQKNNLTTKRQCRVVDKTIRQSFEAYDFSIKYFDCKECDYVSRINESFFDSMKPYLDLFELNNDDDDYKNCKYSCDNLKLIKYEEGGFFHKHSDGTNGDDVRFIFCIQPPEEGGEFILYNDDDTVCKEVKFENNMLILFRPSVLHEAKPVIKGVKYIVTGNIYKSADPLGWHRLYMTGED